MKKEILKDNVVDALTLFVGVGGTGSKIVTRVAELCSPGEVENINFVCLDTNVNDLTLYIMMIMIGVLNLENTKNSNIKEEGIFVLLVITKVNIITS